MWSPELRRALGRLLVIVVVCSAGLVATPAQAATNLVKNASLESTKAGFPTCWEVTGRGEHSHKTALTSDARTGNRAVEITINRHKSGERQIALSRTANCAPAVTPGRQYDLSVWYKSSSAATGMTLYRHDVKAGWQYWTDLATLPATDAYKRKTVRTPPVPAGTDRVAWGVTLYGEGRLVTDEYRMVQVGTIRPITFRCPSRTAACATGSWQVMPYESAVRAIHAVVMHNGKVLLIAGSGNDAAALDAGTFKTAVYDPATGSFTNVATPVDLFCAGHVQLADGKVLVMGGTAAYPTGDGKVGYRGIKKSYLFDPATNTYKPTNDMADGHWYPSATVLGNGDVISLGGLGPDSTGTTTTEYYDASEGRWLGLNEAKQTWAWWGLYPAMVLMQDGRLFYTGSHTFGVGLPGSGASIYDYASGTITDVPGLQAKDYRDQSMSVLLPPAQDQRVFTVGGGNGDAGATAHRLTDIIDLKADRPRYTPGPLLPQGRLANGQRQTGDQGKMYVSLVLLPDGTVLETGGGMHNRADPVFEASIYNPATNRFTPVLPDPVPRTYHSSAFLLPDGRVMAVGENPLDASFDMRISVYSPPYLFKGERPRITSVASNQWAYGTTQRITVDRAVTRASLIRPAAVTHSSDPNQRFVDLPITPVSGNTIGLNLTSNPDLAPPGWYMLFVHDAKGVPSVAKWVRVG